jgi:hypothetical protein
MTEPTHLCKHDENFWCQICEPLSAREVCELNHQNKRLGRGRKGCAPLRRRRKRLHKKLAKRGFSGSPRWLIWSSPVPGYGVRGTKYDF